MTPPRIAVLASGRGSGFEAILAAIRAGRLDAEVVAVLSDRPQVPVLGTAKAAGLPALAVPAVSDRRAHERAVLDALAPFEPDFLVLAGYLRILSAELIDAFRGPRGYARIVNVHPSLLPAFPGVHSYARAFAHGVKVAGVTVHLVEEQVDDGPICAQEAFTIADCRTAGEVEARGLAVEHRLYPETLSWILAEKFDIEGSSLPQQRRPCVRPY